MLLKKLDVAVGDISLARLAFYRTPIFPGRTDADRLAGATTRQ